MNYGKPSFATSTPASNIKSSQYNKFVNESGLLPSPILSDNSDDHFITPRGSPMMNESPKFRTKQNKFFPSKVTLMQDDTILISDDSEPETVLSNDKKNGVYNNILQSNENFGKSKVLSPQFTTFRSSVSSKRDVYGDKPKIDLASQHRNVIRLHGDSTIMESDVSELVDGIKSLKRKSPPPSFDTPTKSSEKPKAAFVKISRPGPILCSPQPLNNEPVNYRIDPLKNIPLSLVNPNVLSKEKESDKKFNDEMIDNGRTIVLDEFSIDSIITTSKSKRLLGGLMNEDRLNTINQKLYDLFKTLTLYNMSFDSKKKIETPKNFTKELNLYQKEGLNFLVSRENVYPCGGILADDMGLGKTAQMIALMVYQKENAGLNQRIEMIRQKKAKENRLIPLKATLILAPLGLINQWESEIKKFTPYGYFNVYQYHGPKRETNAIVLTQYDIIISSYQTIASELSHIFNDEEEGDNKKFKSTKNPPKKISAKSINKMSVLEKVSFRRIILDEAHNIKNRKSKASKACSLISALSRWCVTGTPVHNEMMDAFSLYRFLRCHPIDQEAMWKQYMNSGTALGPLRLKTLVKATLLRRTKDQISEETGEKLVKLPKKHMEKVELEMSPQERSVYDQMFAAAQKFVKCFLDESNGRINFYQIDGEENVKNPFLNAPMGEQDNNFQKMACILVFLLRLRQACNHFYLTKDGLDLDCFDAVEDNEAALIKQNFSLSQTFDESFMENVGSKDHLKIFEESYRSSKVKALFDRLDKIFEKSDDKVIIISQWTSMLKLLHPHFERRNVDYVEITGDVLQKDRQEAQQIINSKMGSKRVMLLSLKAGGVGLNLVGANHIFMLDLHWNPFMEDQACDRIYRIGQTKDVFIHKFVCKNTIERRVLELQEKKRLLSDEFLGENKLKKGNHLNNEDLAFLFDCN
uniref:Helicase ATP-binding domain-containing protein n=1 Tax=Parastrongyloides trichosuri TaxID=131310 RepID=A0A0N5A1D2_PARTI